MHLTPRPIALLFIGMLFAATTFGPAPAASAQGLVDSVSPPLTKTITSTVTVPVIATPIVAPLTSRTEQAVQNTVPPVIAAVVPPLTTLVAPLTTPVATSLTPLVKPLATPLTSLTVPLGTTLTTLVDDGKASIASAPALPATVVPNATAPSGRVNTIINAGRLPASGSVPVAGVNNATASNAAPVATEPPTAGQADAAKSTTTVVAGFGRVRSNAPGSLTSRAQLAPRAEPATTQARMRTIATYSFPVLMSIILAAFVLLSGRFDRNETKVRDAPIRRLPDFVEFTEVA